MSLVNDLLIELDRQNEAESHGSSAFLRDLEPRRRTRRAPLRRGLHGLALTACLLFVGLGLSRVLERRSDSAPTALAPVAARPAATAGPSLADAENALPGAGTMLPAIASARPATGSARPAIAATPPIPRATAVSPSIPTEASVARHVERPGTLRAIEIERRGAGTRVRIEGEPGLLHRIERADAEGRVELVFDDATLRHELGALELVDTPIRAFDVEQEDGGLRLRLDLDAGTRVQSQSLAAPEGTRLFLDLFPAGTSAAPTRAASGPPTAPTEDRWITSDSRDARDAGTSLAIAPSDEDRARRARRAEKDAARVALAEARAAARNGDVATASASYAEALARTPTDHDALIEWATLLARSDQAETAIERVRAARRGAPEDVRLAMLHARLVAGTGRTEEAIALLDRSDATLTQAPEIHALAAALLQRDGRHTEAVERYDAIVRRHPGDARSWLGLAISLEATSRGAEALDVYRIAMQIGTLAHPSRRWVSARIEALEKDEER
ncbi:MAG: tetratricopeptide repeat protein [Myxococcota bacterium]